MIVRARPQEAAFSAAPADFMRSMLVAGGQLLDDMRNDVPVSDTLRYLCSSARELLQADDVCLRLHDDMLGIWGEFESAAGPTGAHRWPVLLVASVTTTAGAPFGDLEIAWSDAQYRPTALDELVASRFATMATLGLDRHLAKRRQLQAIAEERESFAGEIHDDPVQAMTAVSLQLQRLALRMSADEDRQAVEKARKLNDGAIGRLRHVMFSLHPTSLVESGLVAAVEDYCEYFVEPEGTAWSVTGDCVDDLPGELAALAFRLIRNALVNVVLHAHAASVDICFARQGETLSIEIEDDGVGFDTAQVRHTRVGHLGIPHAVTLAKWASGNYTTASTPGAGTTVLIELPTR